MHSAADLTSIAAVQDAIPAEASLVATVAASLYDIWVEAAVIALFLHVYLYLTRSSSPLLRWFAGPASHLSKVPCKVAREALPEKPQAEGKRSPAAPGSRADVRAFVTSALHKGAADGKLMQQYDHFVQAQQVDMRHYIQDAQAARNFYSALIDCGVQVVLERGEIDPSEGALSARATTSRLLADMRIFSFARNHDFYSAILKVHAVNRLFADSMWLYDVMITDGVTPDRTMYGYLVSVAVSCSQDDKAIFFFKEISRMGQVPMRTCMTVLRVYSKNHDWQGAVELLESLKVSGGSPDALVLNTVLGLCVSNGEVGVAEGLLVQWVSSADVVSCNIVLKGFTQQVNLSKAERLLKRMLDRGPVPNIITFNTIMDCAVRHLQQFPTAEQRPAITPAQRQWQFLDMLMERGLEPDRYTCSTLVKGLHLTGFSVQDIDRAVALVRKIGPACLDATVSSSNEATNTRLQEVLFNTLLDACVSARDLDRMAEIFQLMRTFEVELSSVTFGTLIKAFGQAGQLDHCHEVWRNMLDAKVKPTVVTFGCYIDTCIRNGDIAVAEELFAKMPGAGVKPNAAIYSSMIRGYAHAKKSHKALEMYQEMRRQQGIETTVVTFNSVLDIMVRQLALPVDLQEVVDDMRAASIAPDVVTYSILIKASCNAGQIESAVSLFRQLRSQGLSFDEVAFNTLLLACSKADRVAEAEEILGEMRAGGVAPTHVTISILVKMYGKARMLDKAIELTTMVEQVYDMKPNMHVYTCLIQACIRSKQIQKSWEVFGRMLEAGTQPDAVTYGTVIHGCIYHTKLDQAMALVRHAYTLDARDGTCIFQSLGLSAPCNGSRGGAHLRHNYAIPLQTDVLKTLHAALKRKGLASRADELQSIMAQHGKAKLPDTRGVQKQAGVSTASKPCAMTRSTEPRDE